MLKCIAEEIFQSHVVKVLHCQYILHYTAGGILVNTVDELFRLWVCELYRSVEWLMWSRDNGRRRMDTLLRLS